MSMGQEYVGTAGLVTLSASSTKSLWLLEPSTTGNIRLTGLSVSLNGSSAAQAVQFDLYRVNSLGSPAGSSGTGYPMMSESTPATPQSSFLYTLTTEPTSVYVLESWLVQELGGLLVVQWPLGREYGSASSGSRLGFRYTTASGVTPGAIANFYWEE